MLQILQVVASHALNFITKYNLKNNIKHFYYYKNGSRIVFTKSNAAINNDLYLFDFSGDDWYVKINNKEVSSQRNNNSFVKLNYNFYNNYKIQIIIILNFAIL